MARKTKSRKKSSARKRAARPAAARPRKVAAPASRRKRPARSVAKAQARRPPRRRPAPAAPSPPTEIEPQTQRELDADRRRLGRRRGEDMGIAAAHAELQADRQRSRDDVHERDISGS